MNNHPQDGEYKIFHDNGQLRRRKFYKNGKLEGRSEVWYDNGQCREFLSYKNGGLDGECKSWYENGRIMSIEYFHAGKQEGKNKVWHETGNLWYQMFFHNDRMYEVRSWFNSGSSHLYQFYIDGECTDLNRTGGNIYSRLKSKLFRQFFTSITQTFDSFLIADLIKSLH